MCGPVVTAVHCRVTKALLHTLPGGNALAMSRGGSYMLLTLRNGDVREFDIGDGNALTPRHGRGK